MKIDTLHTWAWHLALVISAVVALLSFVSEVSFLQAVLRAILGFGLIYGISELGIYLFEKTALSPEPDSEVGALLDIAVGQEDELPLVPVEQGQEDMGVLYGQAGYSMGANRQAPLAGQVNQDLAQGLPNEEKQAEIVRRMGWGD